MGEELKAAYKITQLLDHAFGIDRFDRGPVPIEQIALTHSKDVAPDGPIKEVLDRNIPGCMGALVFGDTIPRQWAIVCHLGQSPGRRSFTIAHEFGHFMLHRQRIETSGEFEKDGIYCSEDSVLRRFGDGIEKEADTFAATLLMPLHDFRRQISPKQRPDLDALGNAAGRYGVSLTASILRWLEYTETRAIMVVSNEGYALWSKPSQAALRSGRFMRTKDVVYELPAYAIASRKEYTEEARLGMNQPSGVWFDEPLVEMCIRSDRYDQEITLLHFDDGGPCEQDDEIFEDTYDRFSKGQSPA